MTIKTVGIVGAGQMGAGIAQVTATFGFNTFLYDSNQAGLAKGMEGISSRLDRLVDKSKLAKEESDSIKTRIKSANDITELKTCDLVIEAIVENFTIKTELFKKLDGLLAKHAILASNTSSISITKMAAQTNRPEQFIGLHFMNPVPVMQLLEVIKGLQTSAATYQACEDFAKKIKKTTVLGIDAPGFVVNRILCPMINEAIFLVQEGVKPEDIDAGMKLGTNQPMGPLELADFVGLDTLLYILKILHSELGEDKYRPCPLLQKYVEAGWYGRKNGRGFYKY